MTSRRHQHEDRADRADRRRDGRGADAGPRRGLRTSAAAYVGLTKPRIIELLLLTTRAGDVLRRARACPTSGWSSATVVGGTLAAGSANALNCVYDRDIDEQMRRTRRRPLPRHIVSPRAALVFGVVLGVAGDGCGSA